MSPTVEHERILKIFGAYTGFIAAAILAIVTSGSRSPAFDWALSLWVFSLPPLLSYQLLDYHVRVRQKRSKSAIRGVMLGVGIGLSNLGVFALLTSYSWIAAALYLLALPIWPLFVREVAGLGWHKEFNGI